MRQRRSLAVLLGVGLITASGMGTMAMWPSVASHLTYAADGGQAAAAPERLETANDLSTAFRETAKALRPSVVTISSVQRIQPSSLNRGFPGQTAPELPEEFRRFFGDDLQDFFQNQIPQDGFERSGTGSGVIVSKDGYIVTNDHVVRNADEVKVSLSDGREFQAEVVGNDSATDVAVLKIEASGLTPARLGDSDAIEVGDWVLAIGSPMELDQTVTAGIISAKGRADLQITQYEDFIQTDAAINPGNSGGPLVNLHAEVIGINTAIASRTGGNMGIGFAIPSKMVRTVMDEIIRDGRVQRGWLGVAIGELDAGLAQSFGYHSTDGVLVNDVMEDGPAGKAGMRAGDIIVELNDQKIETTNELRNAVASLDPESTADVVVFRDGRTRTLRVKIGQLDQGMRSFQGTRRSSGTQSAEELGLTVQNLTTELAQQLGLESDVQGVVVTRVEAGTPGERAGVASGDVIVRVGSQEVQNVQEFQKALESQDLEAGVRLQLVRDGVRRFEFLREQ